MNGEPADSSLLLGRRPEEGGELRQGENRRLCYQQLVETSSGHRVVMSLNVLCTRRNREQDGEDQERPIERQVEGHGG